MPQWDVYVTGYIRMSADGEPTDEEILEYIKQNPFALIDSLEVESASEVG